MKLSTCVYDFLKALDVEQGATRATVRTYSPRLNHFIRWLEANGYPEPSVEQLDLPVVRRFLYYLSGKQKLRPRTILGYFNAIRSLGKFLVDNGLREDNPAKALTLPKKDAAVRQTVTNEEVHAMLEASGRDRDPRKAALQRAVIHTFVYGGLRRMELRGLHVENVKLEDRALTIKGKGEKVRQIFLPEVAVAALREWLALRPKDHLSPSLFVLDKQRRVGAIALRNLMQNVRAIAGFADRPYIQPHTLRHWRATDLLRAGANLRDIQVFLGHANLQTTSIYLHSDWQQLRDIAELTTLNQQGGGKQAGRETDRAKQRRRIAYR